MHRGECDYKQSDGCNDHPSRWGVEGGQCVRLDKFLVVFLVLVFTVVVQDRYLARRQLPR